MEQDSTVFVISNEKKVMEQVRKLVDPARVEGFRSMTDFLKAGAGLGRAGCVLLDVRSMGADLAEAGGAATAVEIDLPVVVLTGPPDAALSSGPGIGRTLERALQESSSARVERTQQDQIQHRLVSLTPREREVMTLVVEGMSNKMIAHTLGISARTIEIHRARAMHKMGAESLSELVRMACLVGATYTGEPTPREPLTGSGSA